MLLPAPSAEVLPVAGNPWWTIFQEVQQPESGVETLLIWQQVEDHRWDVYHCRRTLYLSTLLAKQSQVTIRAGAL